MAGHSKFKNIQHRKNAQDKKRSLIFGNLVKAIKVASKLNSDPENNHTLRTAINNARKANVPKDRIEDAINNSTDTTNYEEIRYEAYAPHGIALVIEAISDNRNRTASEIRRILGKKGGNLASAGSVAYLFDHLGMLTYSNVDSELLFETALDSGALDLESYAEAQHVFCSVADLHVVQSKIISAINQEADFCRLIWRPKDKVTLDAESEQNVLNLISDLQEDDDVQYVDSNLLCVN